MSGKSRGLTGNTGAEATKYREEVCRAIIECSNDVIFALSRGGAITFLNPAFEEITGWKRSGWIGRSFRRIIHKDDLPRATALYRAVLAGRKTPSLELRVLSKSGSWINAEFTAMPLVSNGKIAGALGIARDITERKKAEDELGKLNERLRVQIAELERFNRLTVGRELKMIELKKRLRELEEKNKRS